MNVPKSLRHHASDESFSTCRTSWESPQPVSPHVRDPDAFRYIPSDVWEKAHTTAARASETRKTSGYCQTQPLFKNLSPSCTASGVVDPTQGSISTGRLESASASATPTDIRNFSAPGQRFGSKPFDRERDSQDVSLEPQQVPRHHSDEARNSRSGHEDYQSSFILGEDSDTLAPDYSESNHHYVTDSPTVLERASSLQAGLTTTDLGSEDWMEWDEACRIVAYPQAKVWEEPIWPESKWSRLTGRSARSRCGALRSRHPLTFDTLSSKLTQGGQKLIPRWFSQRHQPKTSGLEDLVPIGRRQTLFTRRGTSSSEQTRTGIKHKWRLRKSHSSSGGPSDADGQ